MSIAQLVEEYRGRMAASTGGFRSFDPIYRDLSSRIDVTEYPETTFLAHDLLYWSGQSELAAQALEKGVSRHPSNTLMKIMGAQRGIDAGRFSLARDMARQIAKTDPKAMSEQEARNACRVFSAIGHHQRARDFFLHLREQRAEFATGHLGRRLDAAISNKTLVDGISVYSIGEDCRPWLVLNRWGLRDDPARADLMTPFTLEATKTNTVTRYLRNDGVPVTEGLEVVPERDGNDLPVNRHMDIMFNHNRGPYWYAGHFLKLRELYFQRHMNLMASFNAGPRVYVHYSHFAGADLNAIVDALNSRQQNANYRIAVISGAPDAPECLDDSSVAYGKVSEPAPPFTWFAPESFESERGIQYESEIASVAKAAIADLRGSQGLGFKLNAAKRRLSRRAL